MGDVGHKRGSGQNVKKIVLFGMFRPEGRVYRFGWDGVDKLKPI